MSGVDPVQAWREWLSKTHSGPIHIINDEIFKHTEAIAAALEAERERATQGWDRADELADRNSDLEEMVRQRDERIAALEAGLRVMHKKATEREGGSFTAEWVETITSNYLEHP